MGAPRLLPLRAPSRQSGRAGRPRPRRPVRVCREASRWRGHRFRSGASSRPVHLRVAARAQSVGRAGRRADRAAALTLALPWGTALPRGRGSRSPCPRRSPGCESAGTGGAVETDEARLAADFAGGWKRREQPQRHDPVRVGDAVGGDLRAPVAETIVGDAVSERVEKRLVEQAARLPPPAASRSEEETPGASERDRSSGRTGRERGCRTRRGSAPGRRQEADPRACLASSPGRICARNCRSRSAAGPVAAVLLGLASLPRWSPPLRATPSPQLSSEAVIG